MIPPLLLLFLSISLLAYGAMSAFVRDEAAFTAMRRRRSGFLLWVTPALARVDAWIKQLLGPNNAIERSIRNKLRFVGNAYPLDAAELFAAQVLGVLSIPPLLALFLLGGAHFNVVEIPPNQSLLIIVLAAAACLALPIMPIDSIVKRRRSEVLRAWPFLLDLTSIALSSGVGLQNALERVSAALPRGPLAEEITRILNEIRLGSARAAALRAFADRAKLQLISTSVELIIQSEELGTELSSMLSEQAREFRQTEMLRVEKKALEAPVKMMLPMAVFIFPSILGILVGPVLISFFLSK
jgi:tight adherence protein C